MKLFLIFNLVFFISIFKANSKKLIIADISDNKINIPSHQFLNGEKIYYQPQSTNSGISAFLSQKGKIIEKQQAAPQ